MSNSRSRGTRVLNRHQLTGFSARPTMGSPAIAGSANDSTALTAGAANGTPPTKHLAVTGTKSGPLARFLLFCRSVLRVIGA